MWHLYGAQSMLSDHSQLSYRGDNLRCVPNISHLPRSARSCCSAVSCVAPLQLTCLLAILRLKLVPLLARLSPHVDLETPGSSRELARRHQRDVERRRLHTIEESPGFRGHDLRADRVSRNRNPSSILLTCGRGRRNRDPRVCNPRRWRGRVRAAQWRSCAEPCTSCTSAQSRPDPDQSAVPVQARSDA